MLPWSSKPKDPRENVDPASRGKHPDRKDISKELAVEEYKYCKDLILKNIDIIEKAEFYGVGAAGALAIFSVGDHTYQVAVASAFTPCLLAIFGGMRFYVLDQTISRIDNYLVTLEETYGTIGWTKSYRWQVSAGNWLTIVRYLLWVFIFAFGLCFGSYVARHQPEFKAATDHHQQNSN